MFSFFRYAVAENDDDFDIRCCVDEESLVNFFYIKLSSPEHDAIAELQIKTPDNELIGANDNLLTYHPPVKQGLYALTSRPSKPIDSEVWDFTRVAILFREYSGPGFYFRSIDQKVLPTGEYALPKGQYKINVIGKISGRYTLSVCPYGHSNECIIQNNNPGISIKKNQIHTYVFDTDNLIPVSKDRTDYSLDGFDIVSISSNAK